MSAAQPPDQDPLPHEPDAEAELLSATHVFAVEVVGREATGWAAGADGFEHRRLDLTLALAERYKGKLAVAPGQRFPFTVEQRREGELEMNAYHGLWSHTQPEVGTSYLIVSQGPGDAPADLMTDAYTQRLFDGAAARDVAAAIAGEQMFHAALGKQVPDAEATAVGALWAFTYEQRASLGELFAGYLWERTRPLFLREGARLLDDVRGVLLAADAAPELRAALDRKIYRTVLDGDPDPELTAAVVTLLFQVLLLPAAQPLRDSLVDVQLYGLIFPGDGEALAPARVSLDGAQRARLAAMVAAVPSERGERLGRWLDVA